MKRAVWVLASLLLVGVGSAWAQTAPETRLMLLAVRMTERAP